MQDKDGSYDDNGDKDDDCIIKRNKKKKNSDGKHTLLSLFNVLDDKA